MEKCYVGKSFPDVDSVISHFKDAFDWAQADQSGRVIPHPGVNVDYDSACKTIADVESSLAKHLKEQRKALGDSSVSDFLKFFSQRFVP